MDKIYVKCIMKNKKNEKCGNISIKDRVVCHLHSNIYGCEIYGKIEENINGKIYIFYIDKYGDIIMN